MTPTQQPHHDPRQRERRPQTNRDLRLSLSNEGFGQMVESPDVRFFVRSVRRTERIEQIGDLREDAGDEGGRVGELTDFRGDEAFCCETGFAVGRVLGDDGEDVGFDVLSCTVLVGGESEGGGKRTIIFAVHFSNSNLGDPSPSVVARVSAAFLAFSATTLRRSTCCFFSSIILSSPSFFPLSSLSALSRFSASSLMRRASVSRSTLRNRTNSNSLARSLSLSSASAALILCSMDSHNAALRALKVAVRAAVVAAVLRARVERRDWISVRSSVGELREGSGYGEVE